MPVERKIPSGPRARPGDHLRKKIGSNTYDALVDMAGSGLPSRGAKYAKMVGHAIHGTKYTPLARDRVGSVTPVHTLAAPERGMTRRSDAENTVPVATGGISPGVEPMDHHMDFMRRRRRGT